jgi:hypothetical protein
MARAKTLAASDLVRGEWLRRVEEEYRSAAIAHGLTGWLIELGAPPDLIHEGLRIAGDEMDHSAMSHAAFVAAGGKGGPALARETLVLPRTDREPLEHDVVRIGVRIFCLGETVAVPLFRFLREGCTVPPARRVLDRVLRDEVRHRDFGWLLLDWLLDHPLGGVLRAIAEKELPGYFGRLRLAYGAHAKDMDDIDPADRAWGLMPPAEYAGVVERTLERDWNPRFSSRGMDAQRAWDVSLSALERADPANEKRRHAECSGG